MELEDIRKKYVADVNLGTLATTNKEKFNKYATKGALEKSTQRIAASIPEKGTKFVDVNFSLIDARKAVEKALNMASKNGFAGTAAKIKAVVSSLEGLRTGTLVKEMKLQRGTK